jgi:Xaa-Pro aminopeptidase
MVAEMQPGKSFEDVRLACQFFRQKGVQSRPIQGHGIDIVTDKPHVNAENVSAEDFEKVLKPGMVFMAEPNPISADGTFGTFLGHTYIITKTGHECVDNFPLELTVVEV